MTLGVGVIEQDACPKYNQSLFLGQAMHFTRRCARVFVGLVASKGNFYYPWGSKQGAPEPKIWHHDVLRSDGTPYDPQETAFIKQLTGRDR